MAGAGTGSWITINIQTKGCCCSTKAFMFYFTGSKAESTVLTNDQRLCNGSGKSMTKTGQSPFGNSCIRTICMIAGDGKHIVIIVFCIDPSSGYFPCLCRTIVECNGHTIAGNGVCNGLLSG